MGEKTVTIRNVSEKTWHKARLAAFKAQKLIGHWLTEVVEKYLQEENGEEDK